MTAFSTRPISEVQVTRRADMLEVYDLGKSILFACDRLSRGDTTELNFVTAAIMLALTIDPMLSAEMMRPKPAQRRAGWRANTSHRLLSQ